MVKSSPNDFRRLATVGGRLHNLCRMGITVKQASRAALAGVLFLVPCLLAPVSNAQGRDIVCRDGDGDFEAEAAGVRIHVGPAITGGLAVRVCEGAFTWSDQKLQLAEAAPQLDIDAFGVDLGLGTHVAALQVKKTKNDCCFAYEIYSLRAPPVLLRRVTGGEFFSAADTDLDGRVEIWTNDAAAVEGFEGLRLREFDFAPPLVLRFGRSEKLLDASAEFKPYFDDRIAEERAKLDPQDLADFRHSDGVLANAGLVPPARLPRLRIVKMRALEIVWSYLYSGREKDAWTALNDLWPASDAARVREAIVTLHAQGMRSQTDGISTPVRRSRQAHAKIFDGTTTVTATPGLTPKDVKPKEEIIPPRAIVMARAAPVTPAEAELAQNESVLQLVIDAAGKVRSAESLGSARPVDEGLIRSASNWKFIPAYDKGEPVASKILLGVSLRR